MKVEKILLSQIITNPEQPRKQFDNIQELSDSIKSKGLIEPIMVRPIAGKKFMIISGERRFRAASLLGNAYIDAIVRKLSDNEAYKLAVVENMNRENFTPIEEAEALQKLSDMGLKQKEITAITGKSQSYISQKIRLLNTPEFIQCLVTNNSLTENHVRQILRLKKMYPDGLIANPINSSVADWTLNNDEDAYRISDELASQVRCARFRFSEPVVQAFEIFKEYVLKHNFLIQQWEKAAFYWACFSASRGFNVADLTHIIDVAQERYFGCLMLDYLDKVGQIGTEFEAKDVIAARKELALSNSLNVDFEGLDSKTITQIIDYVDGNGGKYAVPEVWNINARWNRKNFSNESIDAD